MKEYRVHISSARHWLKEIEFDGIIGQRERKREAELWQALHGVRRCAHQMMCAGCVAVCEVYCGAFGNCQVILPTINQIMLSVDNPESKIKWLVVSGKRERQRREGGRGRNEAMQRQK